MRYLGCALSFRSDKDVRSSALRLTSQTPGRLFFPHGEAVSIVLWLGEGHDVRHEASLSNAAFGEQHLHCGSGRLLDEGMIEGNLPVGYDLGRMFQF